MHRGARSVAAFLIVVGASTVGGAAPYDPAPRLPGRTFSPAAPRTPSAAADNLLLNPSFETNGGAGSTTIADWTLFNDNAGSEGSFFAQSGSLSPSNGFDVPPPTDGLFAAMSDQGGPGLHIIYQDVALPPGTATVTCDYYVASDATFAVPDPETLDPNVTPNQHVRIDIMDPSAPVDDVGAGVLQNILLTRPGDPGDPNNPMPGYTTLTATIEGGRTIRLRFAEVDNQFFFRFGVDNCSVSSLGAAAVPVLGVPGLLVMVVLLMATAWIALQRRRLRA